MTARGRSVIWMGMAVGVVALVAMSSAEAAEDDMDEMVPSYGWRLRVATRIATFEGGKRFDAVNPNNERHTNPPGPGLSYGFIQWTQGSGNLGKLCAAMRAQDKTTFDAIMGGPALADELMRVLSKPSLSAVGGRVLWDSVWTTRFKALAKHAPFNEVQLRMAATGAHMEAGITVARLLGLDSERGLTLAFDRCVQQGEYGIPRLARSLREKWVAWPSYSDRMQAFGQAAIDRSGGREDVTTRVRAILADADLSDERLGLDAAPAAAV